MPGCATALWELIPHFLNRIAIVGYGIVMRSAAAELSRALGREISKAGVAAAIPSKNAFVLSRWKNLHALFPPARCSGELVLQTSAIPDAQGRVGHDPNRIQAEDMTLTGYVPMKVTAWETAPEVRRSLARGQTRAQQAFALIEMVGNTALACSISIRTRYLAVRTVDRCRPIASWHGDDHLPSDKTDGNTSTRQTVSDVTLAAGDAVTIIGHLEHGEPAPIGYVELRKSGLTLAL
jgi:hypothetical protein